MNLRKYCTDYAVLFKKALVVSVKQQKMVIACLVAGVLNHWYHWYTQVDPQNHNQVYNKQRLQKNLFKYEPGNHL